MPLLSFEGSMAALILHVREWQGSRREWPGSRREGLFWLPGIRLSLRSLRRCILAPWHFLAPTNSQNSQTRYFELYTCFLTLLRVPIFKAAAYFTQRDVTIATTGPAFN